MTGRLRVLSALLALGAMPFMSSSASAQTAPAAPQAYSGAVIAVSYLEYARNRIEGAGHKLLEMRQKVTATPDLLELGVLSELSQPSRFVVLDGWTSARAQAAHAGGSLGLGAADWKGDGALAPADIRLHKPYDVAPAKPAGDDAIFVITHVDVPPPSLPALEAILKPFAERSRREPAALRFDLLQSTTRANHFTMIEIWSSQADFDAHSTAAHTIEFRERLHPLLGALYDQRMFKALR